MLADLGPYVVLAALIVLVITAAFFTRAGREQ
jgi:hypothetical protein